MSANPSPSIMVAVSARSLFQLEDFHQVFVERGFEAYLDVIRKHENEPFQPGAAFPLVQALLRLNELSDDRIVDIVVVSSMHPDAGLSVVNSIEAHGIAVDRAAFTSGGDVVPVLSAFGTNLFLSHSPEDARRGIAAGIAAAIMYDPPDGLNEPFEDQKIRIAFDGDAVVFSEESERIFKAQGKAAFFEHEKAMAKKPMDDGPFGKFLRLVDRIQKRFPDNKPFRLSLVTARGGSARERVLRTLRARDVTMDETYFLNGMEKSGILRSIRPHIFFDDQDRHVSPASKFVPSGLVPSTVPTEADTVDDCDQRENLRAPNP